MTQNALVLGQVATDAKSNEITAIPELLKLRSLRGATVTVAAMGCQREIALAILDRDAQYVMALKDNQPTICTEAPQELGAKPAPRRTTPSFHQTEDQGHGRTEVRRVWVTSKLDHLAALITWPGVQTLIRVESERCVDGKTSVEDRSYLSSRVLTAKEAGAIVRGHWSIENTCHWTLDVVFGEDDARVREGHAPENLGLIRSLILNVFKRDTSVKASLTQKHKICGWDHDFMTRMVRSLFSLEVCPGPGPKPRLLHSSAVANAGAHGHESTHAVNALQLALEHESKTHAPLLKLVFRHSLHTAPELAPPQMSMHCSRHSPWQAHT